MVCGTIDIDLEKNTSQVFKKALSRGSFFNLLSPNPEIHFISHFLGLAAFLVYIPSKVIASDAQFYDVPESLLLEKSPEEIDFQKSIPSKVGGFFVEPLNNMAGNAKEMKPVTDLVQSAMSTRTLSFQLGTRLGSQGWGASSKLRPNQPIGAVQGVYVKKLQDHVVSNLPGVAAFTGGLKFKLSLGVFGSSTDQKTGSNKNVDTIRYGLVLKSIEPVVTQNSLVAAYGSAAEKAWLNAPQAKVTWGIEAMGERESNKLAFENKIAWDSSSFEFDKISEDQAKQPEVNETASLENDSKNKEKENSRNKIREKAFDFEGSIERWSTRNNLWRKSLDASFDVNLKPADPKVVASFAQTKQVGPLKAEFTQPQNLIYLSMVSQNTAYSKWAGTAKFALPIGDSMLVSRTIDEKSQKVETVVSGIGLGVLDSKLSYIRNEYVDQNSYEITSSVWNSVLTLKYREQAKRQLEKIENSKESEQWSLGFVSVF